MSAPKDPIKYQKWKERISIGTRKAMEDPELRKKLSLLKKGKTSPRKGVKLSKEIKNKISIGRTGILLKEKHWNWKGGRPKCPECGKQLANYKAKFCQSCSHRKERAYNWKGNLIDRDWTKLKNKIKKSFEYYEWRDKILKRDNYKCIICSSNKNLEVDHHPIALSELLHKFLFKTLLSAVENNEMWNIDNGRTLCRECHKKYGKKLNQHSLSIRS